MKKQYGKWWIVIICALLEIPLFAFCARYKQDNITIYSIFGHHWGWDNNKPLSEQELEFLVEKFEAERKEKDHNKNQKKKERKGSKKKTDNELLVNEHKTSQDLYKLMGPQPMHMVYTETQQSLWGFKSLTNRWFFNIAWHDDISTQLLSIINETGETLFVELNHNPVDLLSPKNLKGILNGHARRISLLSNTTLAVWRMQNDAEGVNHLLTRIAIPYETSLVQLTKQNNVIICQIIDGSDDEETF